MLGDKKTTDWLLTAFCAITFILGFEIGGFQLALLRATSDFGIDGSMIGLPITFQFVSLSLFPLIFGPVSDRIGKKIIILIFMAVFVTGGFLIWMSGSASQFVLGLFILGAGFGVIECSVTAAISDIYGDKGEKNINLSQSFFCLGAIVSPLIMQALMDNTSASWHVSFLICAIAMAAVIPMLLQMREKPAVQYESHTGKTKIEKPLLLFGFFICMFFYLGIESNVSYFADAVFSLELNAPYLGAYAISLFWALMGVGRFYFGRIKRIPPSATAIMLFITAIVLVCIIFNRNEIVMLILFAACGLGCSCVWPGIINAAVTLNRNASGRVISYLNLGAGTGGMIFPLINGVILNAAGMSYSFILLTVLAVAAGTYMLKNRVNTESFDKG